MPWCGVPLTEEAPCSVSLDVPADLPSNLFVDNPIERWDNSRNWLGTGSKTGFVSDICGPEAERLWMPSKEEKARAEEV